MSRNTPANESDRLAVLQETNILDTPAESEYDDITMLASQICETPIAVISFVDEDRQWFKSQVGLDVTETPRDIAFCSHAILQPGEVMVVEDAATDVRFQDNPLVTGQLGVRFYAGAPLVGDKNSALGTLCVIDREPRKLTDQQLSALKALARQLSVRLELRRTTSLLEAANAELRNLSLKDELTGLYNRRGFLMHARQQLKVYRSRETDRCLWLLLGDLDGLKVINDTYGHPEGSYAIRTTARILSESFRDADIVARPGGDEFTVLILNTTDDVAAHITDRIYQNFADFNRTSDRPYDLSISVGLVKVEFASQSSIEDLIKVADENMYEAKRARRSLP